MSTTTITTPPDSAPVYDADDLIKFFEAIPRDRWHTGYYFDTHLYATDGELKCCALGLCGQGVPAQERHRFGDVEVRTARAQALWDMFSGVRADLDDKGNPLPLPSSSSNDGGIAVINDGKCSRYQQEHPKDRVLAALRDVKAGINLSTHDNLPAPTA